MLCRKLEKFSSTRTVKGTFRNSDGNGFLYLDIKDTRKIENDTINNCLNKLNSKYSRENNCYKNDLYLQEIEYKIGMIYAAIYLPDRFFYRVKLLKMLDYDDKAVVNFIDYGNSEIVPKSSFVSLPDEVASIEPLIMMCVIPNIKIINDKCFTNIIADLYQSEITVTIEGRCLFREELSLCGNTYSDDISMNLIHFDYKTEPIRSFLLNNRIAINNEQNYQYLRGDSSSSNPDSVITDYKECLSSPNIVVNNVEEFNKTVIIIHVNSSSEFFVHEFTKTVKIKLQYLHQLIVRVIDQYKGNIEDNFFSKRNVYLAQFNEDKLWYRCKIAKFDTKKGFLIEFLDFGNHEYKNSLSDMILLTTAMGEDASYLIHEEPLSRKCQLSSTIIEAIPSGINVKKYLIKRFVDNVKKVTITYHLKGHHNRKWLITDMSYHHKSIVDLIKLQLIIDESSPIKKNHNAESAESSHLLYDAADIKVAEYLLHDCVELEETVFTAKTASDYNRSYLVTHVVGLHELWIDLGHGQAREMLENLLSEVRLEDPVSEVTLQHVYGIKMSEETKLKRGRVIDIGDNFVKVHLLEKGTIVNVQLDDIFPLPAAIVALPEEVLPFHFNGHWQLRHEQATINDQIRSVVENKSVRIVRQSPDGRELVDIIVEDRSLVQALMQANMLCPGDTDNWFKSRRLCRHKCIQVSPSKVCL